MSRETGRDVGIARLAAAVLRRAAENPDDRIAAADICSFANIGPDDGRQLASWLERAGVLVRETSSNYATYVLADAWTQRQHRSRPLILLVEDHLPIAGMAELLLTSEGYFVVLTHNPAEAHLILRVTTFDLILTDSYSPTLDLAVRVLKPLLRRSAGTPVVLFTSHHWDPERVQAEGFAEIISKPFDTDEFLEQVGELTAVPSGAPS